MPMVSKTRLTMPRAISSRVARSLIFPKFEAVMISENPGTISDFVMSWILRSTRSREPPSASAQMCSTLSMFSIFFERPTRVPPPTPVPPRYWGSMPRSA